MAGRGPEEREEQRREGGD
uniref:Uncharacterized protein n=1 Tax=Arundo donax TaxID=35708 RepID=A0A0A9B8W6_ARUDO